ncbi:MAG: tRNA pseudouridine(55) synthase TruB [Desulfosalsimonas sp.]
MTRAQNRHRAGEAKKTRGRTTPESGSFAENGVLIIDKPGGQTSAGVVDRVKRLAGIYKAGHAGTLDPFATGVLICPVNRGTRLARFFLHGGKKYRALIRLGTETDTLDRTGKIIAENPVPAIDAESLGKIAGRFRGAISQVPPAYSALKHRGKPLYKYARQGRPVEKPARSVEIRDIKITMIDPPDIGLEISCSGGTYIRALCSDIGKAIGCGAHVMELERTESCGFDLSEAVAPEKLEEAQTRADVEKFIIPMARALRQMPGHTADEDLAEKTRFGKPLRQNDIEKIDKAAGDFRFVKIVDKGGRLLAVVDKNDSGGGYSYCCVFHPN